MGTHFGQHQHRTKSWISCCNNLTSLNYCCCQISVDTHHWITLAPKIIVNGCNFCTNENLYYEHRICLKQIPLMIIIRFVSKKLNNTTMKNNLNSLNDSDCVHLIHHHPLAE